MSILDRAVTAVKHFIDRPKENKELTSFKSSYYIDSQWYPYNPDTLVQKKGGLDIYTRMMIDEQVKASIMIKKYSVIGSGFKVDPASEDEQDVTIKDKVLFDLTDGMSGNMITSLREILSAFSYGFSISEIQLDKIEKGDYAGLIGLKNIRTRPPHTFEFEIDDYGNLLYVRQHTSKGDTKIEGDNLKYLIIYSYNSEFGGWYGTSDLRSAYRPYWSKEINIRFLNIYNERFGMGIITAKYPRGLSKSEQDDLDKIIKNVQAKTGIKIPEGITLEILESGRTGQSAFLETIEKYDKMISKAVLLPDLAGFNDTKGGAYNLGSKQIDMYFNLIANVRSEVEELINEQLIPLLVDLNYAGVSKYPKFKFNPLTDEERRALASVFITALEKGAVIATKNDENYLRDILKFPKRVDSDEVLPVKQPASPFGNVTIPNEKKPINPANPAMQNQGEQEIDDEINPTSKKFIEQNNIKCGKCGKRIDYSKQKEIFMGAIECPYCKTAINQNGEIVKEKQYARQPNATEKKVNFKALDKEMAGREYEYGISLGKIISRIKDSLIDRIISKKIVDDRDYKEIDKLELKYLGDLKLEFGDLLRNAYTFGQSSGRDIIKSGKKNYKVETNWNLPPKEALKYFDSKRFFLTGTENDYITKNVKALLYDGVKNGRATDDVIYNIEEFFAKEYPVFQTTPSGEEVPIDEIPARLETVVRTNYNDAYNQGLMAEYKKPEVADFVPALEYSAIMDGRTSEICTELDGTIYNSNNPIWQKITPPNHFNCRSIVIPVFAGEDYEESDPPDLSLLDEGFGK